MIPSNIYNSSRNNGVLEAGQGVTNIFAIYLGGSRMLFPIGFCGGLTNVCIAYKNLPGPILVINNSSLITIGVKSGPVYALVCIVFSEIVVSFY